MQFTVANIAVVIIILEAFFFLTAIIIREIAVYIFRLSNNTLHKSAKVAAVLTILMIVQFLLGDNDIFKWTLLIVMIFVLFFMLKKTYELNLKKTLLMGLCFILIWAVILALLAYVFVRFF